MRDRKSAMACCAGSAADLDFTIVSSRSCNIALSSFRSALSVCLTKPRLRESRRNGRRCEDT